MGLGRVEKGDMGSDAIPYVVLVRRMEGSPECGHTVQCSYVRSYGAGACFVLLITLGQQQALMGMGMQRLRTR